MLNTKLTALLQILSDGCVHSGKELGALLGLSRGGVWKLIHQLQALEIDIEAKSRCGYRLAQPIELLDSAHIRPHVNPRHQHYLDKAQIVSEIASTHTYLVEQAHRREREILLCLAERQTAGRGRSGRPWLAPFAKNIMASLLWQVQCDFSELSGLSLAVAVAIATALEKYGVGDVQLKWPNDVLWRSDKLCGILIELHSETHTASTAVISFGVNLHAPRIPLDNPAYGIADIATILQRIPERNKLTGLLLDELLTALELFAQGGLQPFIARWNALDALLHQPVTVIAGDEHITGISRGIDSRGHLLLENAAGSMQHFASGEVSLRPLISNSQCLQAHRSNCLEH